MQRQKVERWLPEAGWEAGGNGELLFNGTEFQSRKMIKFWRWMLVMAAQDCECT